jgi:membrane protein involved in colicin uptake
LLESSIATAKAYINDKNISSENKEKLTKLLIVSRKNIDDKTFEKLKEQNNSLKTASEQIKVQIDQTGADGVRKSQATLEVQKNVQELLKSSFTSETDKQLLNTGLYNITAAKTESSANSAVITLKATIAATQKHNKPAEDKAKAEAEKKAAEAAKAAAEKVEAERKAAEKAEADRKAAEVAQAAESEKATQAETANVNNTAASKWAIEDGYTWYTRKGHSTVIPPGGSLPPGYHWQVP